MTRCPVCRKGVRAPRRVYCSTSCGTARDQAVASLDELRAQLVAWNQMVAADPRGGYGVGRQQVRRRIKVVEGWIGLEEPA